MIATTTCRTFMQQNMTSTTHLYFFIPCPKSWRETIFIIRMLPSVQRSESCLSSFFGQCEKWTSLAQTLGSDKITRKKTSLLGLDWVEMEALLELKLCQGTNASSELTHTEGGPHESKSKK